MIFSGNRISPIENHSLKVNGNIYADVNFFLNFQDKAKYAAFRRHQQNETVFGINLMAHVLISAYLLMSRTGSIVYFFSPFAVVNFALALFTVIVGTCNIVLERMAAFQGRLFHQYVRNIWIMSIYVTFCLGLIFFSFGNTLHHSHCDVGVPNEVVIATLMLPSIMGIVVGNIRWDFQCLSWCLNSLTLLFCIVYFEFYVNLRAFLVCVPISLFLLYSFQVQSIRLYLTTESRIWSLIDKEKLVELEHLTEMRSLIANMAHDLKTVSILGIFVTDLLVY